MNPIAWMSGERIVYWIGLIQALGLAAGLCLALGLFPRYNRHNAAVWVFFPFALVLGLFFARVIYWYCHLEQFPSFLEALADWNTGSYALPGVVIGVMLAAWIVKRLRLVQHAGRLLDAVAPGLCLSFAFIRLSALFNSVCRSRITVSNPLFRRLPFAVKTAGSGGAETWSLAVFFFSFLLLLVITVLLICFYQRCRRFPMLDGSSCNGNVFRLFLLLWGVTEVLVDSLRYDSCLMHFTLLKQLNPYASFVSIGQVFAGVTILCVLIRFTCVRVRGEGFNWKVLLAWLLFLFSLVGAGYFGEYRVQRTGNYLQCYAIQIASLLVMAFAVWWVYRGCEYRGEPD